MEGVGRKVSEGLDMSWSRDTRTCHLELYNLLYPFFLPPSLPFLPPLFSTRSFNRLDVHEAKQNTNYMYELPARTTTDSDGQRQASGFRASQAGRQAGRRAGGQAERGGG